MRRARISRLMSRTNKLACLKSFISKCFNDILVKINNKTIIEIGFRMILILSLINYLYHSQSCLLIVKNTSILLFIFLLFLTATKNGAKTRQPLSAFKSMLQNNSYKCLRHPVCCKYLKAKWREFGWKLYSASFVLYSAFLISLNVYAFGIPSYEKSFESSGMF